MNDASISLASPLEYETTLLLKSQYINAALGDGSNIISPLLHSPFLACAGMQYFSVPHANTFPHTTMDANKKNNMILIIPFTSYLSASTFSL